MNLVSGIHHVAVITADIDRFLDFYTDVFEMPVFQYQTLPEQEQFAKPSWIMES